MKDKNEQNLHREQEQLPGELDTFFQHRYFRIGEVTQTLLIGKNMIIADILKQSKINELVTESRKIGLNINKNSMELLYVSQSNTEFNINNNKVFSNCMLGFPLKTFIFNYKIKLYQNAIIPFNTLLRLKIWVDQ